MDKNTLIHVIDMVWLVDIATKTEYGSDALELLEAIRYFLKDRNFFPSTDGYSNTVVAAFSILYEELDKLRCMDG